MSKRSDFRDAEIGKRLRALRLRRGRSQSNLGEALGVSFQQIQKYERGVNRVGASRLFDLSRVLDVPITFFYADLEARSKPRELSVTDEFDFLQTPSAMRWMRAFAQIKEPSVRLKFLRLAEMVASK